jgi:hypothetical protein
MRAPVHVCHLAGLFVLKLQQLVPLLLHAIPLKG